VNMANDIANFFHGAADPGTAPRSVADHIRRYWDPRMRKQIIAY
jgi:formate dehydrogenase subunit delta